MFTKAGLIFVFNRVKPGVEMVIFGLVTAVGETLLSLLQGDHVLTWRTVLIALGAAAGDYWTSKGRYIVTKMYKQLAIEAGLIPGIAPNMEGQLPPTVGDVLK